MTGRLLIASAAVLVVVVAAAVWLAGRSGPEPAPAPSRAGAIGPSTDTEPYLVPVADGVHIRSLLTVEDGGSASDGYELTGLPDGLGAVAAGGTEFALLMNHEIDAGAGGVRRHGQRGAYVSTFTIDRVSLEVKEGSDTIDPGVRYWNYLTREYQDEASPDGRNPRKRGDEFQAQGDTLVHFCSGTLSAPRQFVSSESGSGYPGQIYFANEELDPDGRVFGVLLDGETQQLPRLGLFAHENTKPAYNRSDTTLAIGTEDTAHGQVHVYAGTKQADGNAFDRAGLTNGTPPCARPGRRERVLRQRLPRRVRQGQAGRVRPRRGRLGPVGTRSERRGPGEGADSEPHRGRRVGPAPARDLLLHDHRGRQRRNPRARRRRPVEAHLR